MDYSMLEKLRTHYEEMQPAVPDWCAAENMQKCISLRDIWNLIKGKRS